MEIFIGIAVLLALLCGLAIWTSRHTYRSGPDNDIHGQARVTKTRAQDKGTQWGAGT